MIVSSINGGLGNQMFQYAVGRHLSLRTAQPLALDLRAYRKSRYRAYGLDQFNIHAPEARPHQMTSDGSRLQALGDRINKLLGRPRKRPVPVGQQSFAFEEEVLKRTGPMHLMGYWQTERYFVDIAETIRDDFALAQPMSAYRANIQRQIEGATTVSLHARRGDYVSKPNVNRLHGTCEPDWFDAAMKKMIERLGDVTFVVFSDDPQWVRDNIQPGGPVIFADPQPDGRDSEDLHLMAACRAHIISNSTFSWWGAWLNPDPEKYVIAPRNWFRDAPHDTSDVLPPSWERL